MLDLSNLPDCAWPEKLRPIGEGTFEKENFASWWCRYENEFSHLDSRVLEQWVHRHWLYSDFSFIPLDTLNCELVVWPVDQILGEVFNRLEVNYAPQFDYDVFHEFGETHPTAKALDLGAWDYPIIVVRTPSGIRTCDGCERPEVRFLLVEGHQRVRYLNALNSRSVVLKPQDLFILRSPVVR
jgi:hypothetical protein